MGLQEIRHSEVELLAKILVGSVLESEQPARSEGKLPLSFTAFPRPMYSQGTKGLREGVSYPCLDVDIRPIERSQAVKNAELSRLNLPEDDVKERPRESRS